MIPRASRPALWMLASAFSFATMGALTYGLRNRCDWLIIALVRSVFMLAMAASMARLAGARLVLFDPPTLWIRSLAGSVSLVCNFYAMTRLPVADVLTITNMYPIWIVVLSALLLRMPTRRVDLLGIVCGLAGVILIQRPELQGQRLASLVALAASLATAVAMLGLHRLKAVDTRAVVAHFSGVASVIAGVWLVLRGPGSTPWPTQGLTLLMLLGVAIAGTLGQLCLTRAYTHGTPARISAVGLSQVAFALGFDILIWQRRVGLIDLLGFVLILGPTAYLSTRAGRTLRPPALEVRTETAAAGLASSAAEPRDGSFPSGRIDSDRMPRTETVSTGEMAPLAVKPTPSG